MTKPIFPKPMKHNWRKTPARLYMKCLIVALHDTGLRGKDLITEFERILPYWKRQFNADGPITGNALINRADKGRRKGYENEWPDKNALTMPFWEQAVRDVTNGTSSFAFGRRAARRFAAAAEQRPSA